MKLLPHRYPFLMVDRVIDIRGDEHGIGIKNVTINEPQFQGHFPGNPVFPGVLMIEGMAQTAGVLCIAATGAQAEIGVFSHHRQGEIPQACAAGRYYRIPHETDRAAQIHVVVSRRSESRRPDRRGSRSRRHAFRRMSARMIDPSARVEAGATIGNDVTIGPYCTVGAHVRIGDGCRLVAHVNLTGHTTIGPRTVIHPFASLGSPPQSFSYRGGPTTLVVGADCDIRENVTMNTGTEDGGGVTRSRRSLLFHGRAPRRRMIATSATKWCSPTTRCSAVTSPLAINVVFGGGVAVRQFVRIGEGAMIVGLSGVRADVIPFAMAHGPLANLVGLNVVGMRRRGLSKADIHRVRAAYRSFVFRRG